MAPHGERVLSALEGVVSDAFESTEMDREKELENERRRSDSLNLMSGKVTRNKKQRSLLMSLVT
jgi:hypothetical protein